SFHKHINDIVKDSQKTDSPWYPYRDNWNEMARGAWKRVELERKLMGAEPGGAPAGASPADQGQQFEAGARGAILRGRAPGLAPRPAGGAPRIADVTGPGGPQGLSVEGQLRRQQAEAELDQRR